MTAVCNNCRNELRLIPVGDSRYQASCNGCGYEGYVVSDEDENCA